VIPSVTGRIHGRHRICIRDRIRDRARFRDSSLIGDRERILDHDRIRPVFYTLNRRPVLPPFSHSSLQR
jgi:hypothetical protein